MRFMDDKVAIVTGGTSGIGLAVAHRLIADGCRVAIITDRGEAEMAEACRQLGENSCGFACDVRDRTATEFVGQRVLDHFGRIDILVNNAGVIFSDSDCARDFDAFRKLFDVNVGGTYNMILAVLPAMKARRCGNIVNISSAAAVRGMGGAACYAASKAAIVALTATLPQEWKGMGIRVNAVGPGAVRTDMIAGVHTPQSEEMRQYRQAIADMVPSPDPSGEFVLDPEDVANVVHWLCTERSWGVNGSLVLVDHGLSGSQHRPQLCQPAYGPAAGADFG